MVLGVTPYFSAISLCQSPFLNSCSNNFFVIIFIFKFIEQKYKKNFQIFKFTFEYLKIFTLPVCEKSNPNLIVLKTIALTNYATNRIFSIFVYTKILIFLHSIKNIFYRMKNFYIKK